MSLSQQQLVVLPQGGVAGEVGCNEFLDILQKNGAINKEVAEQYRNNCASAEELYIKLSQQGTSDIKLSQAYAQYIKADYIEEKKVNPDIVKTIPVRLINQYNILPYALNRRILKIAVAQPYRLRTEGMQILTELAQKSNLQIVVAVTSVDVIGKYTGESIAQSPTASTQSIDLKNLDIPKETLLKLPQEIAGRLKVIAFEAEPGGVLKIGAVDPSSQQVKDAVKALERENQVSVDLYTISPESFDVAYKLYADVGLTATGNQILSPNVSTKAEEPAPSIGNSSYSDSDLDKAVRESVTKAQDISPFIESGNVPQIIASIIKLAAVSKASDIHIEAQKDMVLVRFRIDGLMKEEISIPATLQEALIARIKILSKLKIDETRLPQDGRFDVITGGHNVDVRVTTMPTVFGEKAVLRLLDKNAGLFDIKSLGMTGENYKHFIRAIEKPYGVVMVTGPTGAGKSTTLYASINHLKRASTNIVTLEDPVEYEIPGINQIQIKPNIGFTFAEGLSSVLRQDPNIIMVGEIRDVETANLVTHAALTGHVVLTTLHTNDASGAMPRLVDMGVEPFLIASAINAIVGQRLVRKLCDKCRQQETVPEDLRVRVESELRAVGYNQEIKFYKSQGCPACGGSGFHGRLGIFEVMEIDDGLEALIVRRTPATEIAKYALSKKMYPMKIDGYFKALQGLTSIDEVLRATAIN